MKKILTCLLILLVHLVHAATDAKQAYKMVKDGKAILVDVREKEELSSGMIKDAIWFPKSKITSDPNWKEKLAKRADGKKVFLYCRTGKRSGESEVILEEKGFEAESIGGYEELSALLPTASKKR